MSNNYIESLNEVFGSDKEPSAEELNSFFQKSVEMMTDMQKKLTSSDEASQEEALQSAALMKEQLEEKIKALCEASGIDLEKLLSLEEETDEFLDEEETMVKDLEGKLENLLEEIK